VGSLTLYDDNDGDDDDDSDDDDDDDDDATFAPFCLNMLAATFASLHPDE